MAAPGYQVPLSLLGIPKFITRRLPKAKNARKKMAFNTES